MQRYINDPQYMRVCSVCRSSLRMFKLVLLLLSLSGLQAAPIAAPKDLQEQPATFQLPDGFRQGTENSHILGKIPEDFRQGTEPSRRIIVDLNTGLVKAHVSEMERRVAIVQPAFGNGFGEMERKHWLADEITDEVPVQKKTEGWIRVQDTSASYQRDGFRQGTELIRTIPEGFRQGTEPLRSIPEGFRQGTEPLRSIPEGFRQGTEPLRSIPEGFRQGTEPLKSIPEGFGQGTKRLRSIPEGFRQGTEPIRTILEGLRQGTESLESIPEGFRRGTEQIRSMPERFRQGTEPIRSMPEGFRQGTEPSGSKQRLPIKCEGQVINGECYEFNPTPLAFRDAQELCRALAPNAELASITSQDLQSRLVSLVTTQSDDGPPPTWLGGTVKNLQTSWVDGSEWTYSDWMPGQPNTHTDRPVCVEMFDMGESWWKAADCELRRASICSHPLSV